MTTIVMKQSQSKNMLGSTPYGNTAILHYVLKTDATGKVVGATAPQAALAVGDVVKVGPLPAGLRLVDCQVIVVTPLTAATITSIGFDYADGDDSAEVLKKDAAYFGSGILTSAAARLRTTSAKAPAKLEKPGVLTLTMAGAANAKEAHIEVLLTAIVEGTE